VQYDPLTGQVGYADDVRHDYPLGTPTMAEPGTEAKIMVMCSRVENSQRVTHPDDSRVYTQPRHNRSVRNTEVFEDLCETSSNE